MKQIKNSTRLAIFSTLLMVAAMLALYIMLLSDINSELLRKGINYTYSYVKPEAVVLLILTGLLAYFVSSVVIDKVLNPIRLMVLKVNEVADMNFAKPLSINTDDSELREYIHAFNNMTERLGSYIERQRRFISDASHELTTPITVINGHADLLLRWGKGQPDLLDDELKIIKMEALRMSDLVDNLLLLARSDNGKQIYSFEYIPITRLIRESVSEAEILAPDFIFDISIGVDFPLKCDEYAIRRVLRIILSNAVKYSGDGRLIEIKAGESHGLAHVSIRDNGIGITSEHLPRIFDRFYRVDASRSKKSGSSGLGLAIAKEIVEAHGGEITAASEPGEWTEFDIILPV